jgi:hypothetical protein
MHQAKRSIAVRSLGAVVGAGMVLAAAGSAMAQNNQAGSTTVAPATAPREVRTGPLPAPVGHRQVRPSDLPADAVKNENKAEQGLREFDSKLRICKGC